MQRLNHKVQEVLELLGVVETIVSKGTRFASAQQEETPAALIVPPSPLPFPVMSTEELAPKEEGPVGAAGHNNYFTNHAESNHRNLPSIRAAGRNAASDNGPQIAIEEDLVTEAATPAPLPSHHQPEFIPQRLGSYAPGLEPNSTMVDAFASLVDYLSYRLSNTAATLTAKESRYLHHVKRKIDRRYPNLESYSGRDGVMIFSFLATLFESFDATEASEAVAVYFLREFLTDAAKSEYISHLRV